MTMHTYGPKIETWLAPLNVECFRAEYWLRKPWFKEAGAAALGEWAQLGPAHAGDDEWLHSLGGFPQVPILADGRLVSTASVPMSEAKKFLAVGQTIYVTDPEALIPVARDLAETFELPQSRVACNIYVSSKGCYTPAHFDATDSFVLQLKGTKTWTLAPNATAPMPLAHWGLLEPVPAEIRAYAPGQWPREMPDQVTSFVAMPGSLLYVPRGYWHATESGQESVSAHVHYRSVTWAHLARDAVFLTLARHPDWRRSAYGFAPQGFDRSTAIEEATVMLQRLHHDVIRLSATDLLGPTPRPDGTAAAPRDVFRRLVSSTLGIERGVDGGCVVRVTLTAPLHERATELAMPDDLLPACIWVAERLPGDLVAATELAAFGIDEDDSVELLGELERAGLLEYAPTTSRTR